MVSDSLESDLKTVLLKGESGEEISASIIESLQRISDAFSVSHKLAEEVIDLDLSQRFKERNKDLEDRFYLCRKIAKEKELALDGLDKQEPNNN
jgi:hypothetical protein